MLQLDADQLPAYLHIRHLLGPDESCRVNVLSGGVSNVVLRVEAERRPPFVIKQSRERLRTEVPWFSRLDRIFRETAVMRALEPLLPTGAIPRILDEDRQNYAYAMEAVDADHRVWKQELLSGRLHNEIATRLGGYLAAIHGRTQGIPTIAQEFDDREIFVQLRVDPFYRRVARAHPDLEPAIDSLIDQMWRTRLCLVHGDFSPKNVLIVDPPRDNLPEVNPALRPTVTLVDFETGHYGDPAFDLGFFLSHLLLKAVRASAESLRFVQLARVFWNRYRAGIEEWAAGTPLQAPDLEQRAVVHLAACALARIDGTSPVDYLTDPADRDVVRAFSRRLLTEPVGRLPEAFAILLEFLAARDPRTKLHQARGQSMPPLESSGT